MLFLYFNKIWEPCSGSGSQSVVLGATQWFCELNNGSGSHTVVLGAMQWFWEPYSGSGSYTVVQGAIQWFWELHSGSGSHTVVLWVIQWLWEPYLLTFLSLWRPKVLVGILKSFDVDLIEAPFSIAWSAFFKSSEEYLVPCEVFFLYLLTMIICNYYFIN